MEILLVEDDNLTSKLVQVALRPLGYEVLLAENGLKAWELFQEKNIRIVITDWMMPKMDGLALCSMIREASLSDYVYIVLLTARNLKEDIITGLETGADDYIIKPFDSDDLRSRIRIGQRIIQFKDESKIIESSLDGIVVSDGKGYVTRVNNAFLEMIACEKEEEIIGKQVAEFAPTTEGTYESTFGDLIEIDKKFFDHSEKMISNLFEEEKIVNWESYLINNLNFARN